MEANIKLDSVISDILGLSGRRMIAAMTGGQRNPIKLRSRRGARSLGGRVPLWFLTSGQT